MPNTDASDMRLSSPHLDFWFDVRVRAISGRWIAIADSAGDPELGLGPTARQAVRESLTSLGPSAALQQMRSAK
jgi:hypothetical protein